MEAKEYLLGKERPERLRCRFIFGDKKDWRCVKVKQHWTPFMLLLRRVVWIWYPWNNMRYFVTVSFLNISVVLLSGWFVLEPLKFFVGNSLNCQDFFHIIALILVLSLFFFFIIYSSLQLSYCCLFSPHPLLHFLLFLIWSKHLYLIKNHRRVLHFCFFQT